jgi:hypothetical protein
MNPSVELVLQLLLLFSCKKLSLPMPPVLKRCSNFANEKYSLKAHVKLEAVPYLPVLS